MERSCWTQPRAGTTAGRSHHQLAGRYYHESRPVSNFDHEKSGPGALVPFIARTARATHRPRSVTMEPATNLDATNVVGAAAETYILCCVRALRCAWKKLRRCLHPPPSPFNLAPKCSAARALTGSRQRLPGRTDRDRTRADLSNSKMMNLQLEIRAGGAQTFAAARTYVSFLGSNRPARFAAASLAWARSCPVHKDRIDQRNVLL